MNGEFLTESLESACYVVAMGAPLPVVRPGRRLGMVEFCFDDPDGWVEWTAQELGITDTDGNQTAMVSAPRLFSAIRKIKRLTVEAKGEPYKPAKAGKHKVGPYS
jgi:hypothetical protein